MFYFEIMNRTKEKKTYTIYTHGSFEMPSGGTVSVRVYVDGKNVKSKSSTGSYRYPTLDSGNYTLTLESGQSATLRGYANSSPDSSGSCTTTAQLYVDGKRVATKTASATGWGAAVNTSNYIVTV